MRTWPGSAVATAPTALVLAMAATATAADRALLVGVSRNQSPIPVLPGVARDVEAMTEAAAALGFRRDEIRVVTGDAATRAGIVGAVEEWLVGGVGPHDRALFYYSGHGTRVPDLSGDEADGLDEALVPADVIQEDGRFQNVLLDDDLGPLLRRIRARSVVAFVDACHSGTMTRDIVTDTVPKFVDLGGGSSPGRPSHGGDDVMDAGIAVALDSRLVVVSAADETEVARATPDGSLFTAGVRDAVGEARRDGRPLSPNDIRDAAEGHIARYFAGRPQLAHKPAIEGNPFLAAVSLLPQKSRGPDQRASAAWSQLEEIARHATYRVPLRARASYRAGEPVSLQIDVPRDGYLTVTAASAGEAAAVRLFPSGPDASGAVKAGDRIDVPGPADPVGLRALLPPGRREQETLLLATLSAARRSTPVQVPACGTGGCGAGLVVVVVRK